MEAVRKQAATSYARRSKCRSLLRGVSFYIAILIIMTDNKNLVERIQVDGKELVVERQSENCWVNLTEMAKPFGKRPVDWLRWQTTKDYLQVLADKINECCVNHHITSDQSVNSHFASIQKDNSHVTPEDLIVVRKGGQKGEAGTWCTDYRIAMRFAQWLDARFSVEVDTLLVRIAHGELIVNDNSLFSLGGEQWISSYDYCRAFGKSMYSFYGLMGNYPQSFCNWKGLWYISRELFNMKESQLKFEDRRTKLRQHHEELQYVPLFSEAELNGEEA